MRRRFVLLLTLLVCCLPAGARAGRVFGDIKIGSKPVAAGVQVIIARLPADGAKTRPVPVDTTATDEFGSYKLVVKEPGKCVISMVHEKQPVSLEVYSYKEATRYDLILEKKDGKLTLRRK